MSEPDVTEDGSYLLIGGGKTFPLRYDWAVELLALWRQRQPAAFGAYLAEVVTGAKPKAARGTQ